MPVLFDRAPLIEIAAEIRWLPGTFFTSTSSPNSVARASRRSRRTCPSFKKLERPCKGNIQTAKGDDLALRAIISRETPDASREWEELWYGGVGTSEDEEGSGITTAAVLSFIPDARPGIWYGLADFEKLIDQTDWRKEAGSWTSLNLAEEGVDGTATFTTDIQLGEAIESVLVSARDLLKSLDRNHIWIRFE